MEPGADARWTRRAFAGATPSSVAACVGLCVVWGLERIAGYVTSEHWLSNILGEVGFHVVLAAVLGLPVLIAGNLGPPAGERRFATLGLAVALSGVLAALLRFGWVLWLVPERYPGALSDAQAVLRISGRYAVAAGALALVVELYRRETHSIEAMRRAEVDRLSLEREMEQARLAVLQAQIEPHFLFNTLANVRRLYQTNLAAGREMLDHLMRYLAVALPRMREQRSTLAREVALIEAYLEVQRIRMGRRLAYALDVADELNALEMPPMMLLTLVENAIKHGLNPLPDGGFIVLRAERRGARLSVEVADTGRGLQASSGAGAGLANIRARLAAEHGSAASLELVENRPRGVRAVLALPAIPTAAP